MRVAMLLTLLIAFSAASYAQTTANAETAITERQLMEALAQNPEDPEANFNLSKYYFDQAQQLDAQRMSGKAAGVAGIQNEINRLYGMALPGAELVLAINPENKDARNMLLTIYENMGDAVGIARIKSINVH